MGLLRDNTGSAGTAGLARTLRARKAGSTLAVVFIDHLLSGRIAGIRPHQPCSHILWRNELM
jgi:hypothetical protein